MTSAPPGWADGAGATDLHTHSDRTDGADCVEAMADAAVASGLSTWGISDHVRASTPWVAEYVLATRAIRREGLAIRCGVEAKILDRSGRLDLPPTLPALDYVLVADHQFPGSAAPRHPADVRSDLEARRLSAADVVSDLVEATAAGVRQSPFPPIVAHLFSLLPKMGLSEGDVTAEHLHVIAHACLESGGAVEVNEKWRCPSPAVVAYLVDAGVRITCGSDAHRLEDVGARAYVDDVVAAIDVPTDQGRREPRPSPTEPIVGSG